MDKDINRKILGTCSERIKKQLKEKYAEKNKEVKRSIKADKRKWMRTSQAKPKMPQENNP